MARQAQPEGGAIAGTALDGDRAPVLFENAAADGKSESGTARPGAESGVKDAGQIVGRNARPGVAHRDLYAGVVMAMVLRAVLRAGRRSAFDAANREPSAARHEAKGVEREIEQHLFEAVTVGRNRDAVEAVDDLHFDARLL